MTDHRKPPKPKFYHTHGNGSCRYCGEDILKDGKINKRASWHPKCVEEYRLIHFPNDTRKAVFNRDRGKCYMCGETTRRGQWDVEHKKPLFEAKGRIEYWMMDNLGTACKPCHKKKSAEEAARRASKRRKKKSTAKNAR